MKDFANALKEEVIATNVDLRIQLHKGLLFKNSEDIDQLKEEGSICERAVGNVTSNT